MKQKRNYKLEVRLLQSEKIIIREKAKSVGLGMSSFIRKTALEQRIVNKTDKDMIRQIKYIGNNINQIAHELNTYSDGMIIKEAYKQMEDYKKILSELIEIINAK